MKKLSIVMVMIGVLMTPSVAAFPNEPDGFFGVKFGTPIEKIDEDEVTLWSNSSLPITRLEGGNMVFLARPEKVEDLYWEGLEIRQCFFYFRDKKLAGVYVLFRNRDWLKLDGKCREKFGEPDEALIEGKELVDTLIWNGKASTVTLRDKQKLTADESVLIFMSREFLDDKGLDDEEKVILISRLFSNEQPIFFPHFLRTAF